MKAIHYILIIGLILHIVYGVKYQKQILKSTLLEPKQKLINSILIWSIPFIWYIFLKGFINEDNPTITKKLRKKYRKKDDTGGFYESRKGFHW